jgi:hypothetical protein
MIGMDERTNQRQGRQFSTREFALYISCFPVAIAVYVGCWVACRNIPYSSPLWLVFQLFGCVVLLATIGLIGGGIAVVTVGRHKRIRGAIAAIVIYLTVEFFWVVYMTPEY